MNAHARLRCARALCLVAGIAGLGLAAAAALLGSDAAWQSYLLALAFWTGLSLGALALTLIHGLTGGRWGDVIGPELDAATRALPLLALLFAPLLLGLDRIFPWAGADVSGAVVRDGQRWYLNATFFGARLALFFVLWLALTYLGAADRRGTSAVGLIALTLTGSLAAVDWIGSLLPQFYSAGFGLLVVTGNALGALAMALLSASPRARASTRRRDAREDLHDLGKLALTLVLATAYLALMHFVTIWVADLPREIVWYLPRLAPSWRPLALGVATLEFGIPFAILLSRRARSSPGPLAAVAALLLIGRLLDTFWLIAPTFSPDAFTLRPTDATALIGVGGLWLALYLGRLERTRISWPSGAPHAAL